MNRSVSVVLALVAIVSFAPSSGLVEACRAAEQRDPAYSGDVADVRVVRRMEDHAGANLVWEPYIAQWKPRHLVVSYGAGLPGKTDMGDIYASVSTNDGDTWGYPVVVFDHDHWQGSIQFSYNNSILFKPPGQDVLWCFCQRCPMNAPNSEDAHLAAAYSADGGLSWTPVEMAMHYTGPLIVVAGIQAYEKDGKTHYLLPAHINSRSNNPMGTREQFVLTSTSLLEWRLAGVVPRPENVFPHEGNIAEGAAPGELKIMMRTATFDKSGQSLDPPRAYSSTSRDGGRTWSMAKPEPELWNSVSKCFYGCSSGGEHIYVYNDGPAWSRMALRYKLAPAGGAWGEEKTFYDSGAHNSYPTLIEVSPGDYRAVWDSGTKDRHRTNIRFGKFRPKP